MGKMKFAKYITLFVLSNLVCADGEDEKKGLTLDEKKKILSGYEAEKTEESKRTEDNKKAIKAAEDIKTKSQPEYEEIIKVIKTHEAEKKSSKTEEGNKLITDNKQLLEKHKDLVDFLKDGGEKGNDKKTPFYKSKWFMAGAV